jgi:hypothetical protein
MKNNEILTFKLCYPIEDIFNNIVNTIANIDNDKYSNSIYYNDMNNEYVAEYDINNMYFWCNYDRFWSKFELNNKFNYITIQFLLKSLVEKHFKFKIINTRKTHL